MLSEARTFPVSMSPALGARPEALPLPPQLLAARYLLASSGLGFEEKRMMSILKYVGEHGLQGEFDRAVRDISNNAHFNALDVAAKEFRGGVLRNLFLRSKYKRAEDLYTSGQDQNRATGLEYRLEGAAGVGLELWEALKKSPLTTLSIFGTVAIAASFTPFGAAKLSNAITLVSLLGIGQNELKAAREKKGTAAWAEHLRHAGENWMGVGINIPPLPAVVHHMDTGLDTMKAAYTGVTKAAHEAGHELPFAVELLKSLPGFAMVNAKMAWQALNYAARLPMRLLKNPVGEVQRSGKAVFAAVSDGSNLPEVLSHYGHAIQTKNPVEFVLATWRALTAQLQLAITLLDESIVPFVKLTQASKSKQAGGKQADSATTITRVPFPTSFASASFPASTPVSAPAGVAMPVQRVG